MHTVEKMRHDAEVIAASLSKLEHFAQSQVSRCLNHPTASQLAAELATSPERIAGLRMTGADSDMIDWLIQNGLLLLNLEFCRRRSLESLEQLRAEIAAVECRQG